MVTTRMKIIIVKDGTCHRTCHGSIRQRHRQEVKHDMDMCTPTVEEGMPNMFDWSVIQVQNVKDVHLPDRAL
jgi:hypothetical protein